MTNGFHRKKKCWLLRYVRVDYVTKKYHFAGDWEHSLGAALKHGRGKLMKITPALSVSGMFEVESLEVFVAKWYFLLISVNCRWSRNNIT